MQDHVNTPGQNPDPPLSQDGSTPVANDDLDARLPVQDQEDSTEMELFETFPDQEQAAPVLRILDESGIPYVFEENRVGFDPSFAHNVMYQAWVLKLPSDRFEEARRCLEEAFSHHDVQLPQDHYLREFSIEELLDLMAKADEWSELDVVMARQMLDEKGSGLSDAQVEAMRQARRTELALPAVAATPMVIAAYFLSLIGGVPGILMGWVLKNSTKTTAFGDKVPNYDPASRAHGGRAMMLGAVVAVTLLAILVLEPELLF